MMEYSDYDNPQWDVDRVKLEFKTGETTMLSVSLLSSGRDATEMRSGLLLSAPRC